MASAETAKRLDPVVLWEAWSAGSREAWECSVRARKAWFGLEKTARPIEARGHRRRPPSQVGGLRFSLGALLVIRQPQTTSQGNVLQHRLLSHRGIGQNWELFQIPETFFNSQIPDVRSARLLKMHNLGCSSGA